MKKVLFLFTFLLCAGFMTAQDTAAKKSCSKKCAKTCASKSASTSDSADADTKVASAESVADIAAASDETIEKKVCDVTGSVSYFKKTTCEHSGSVKMTEVQYDESNSEFVNVSPKDAMADQEAHVVKTGAKECSPECKKACCADKKTCAKKGTKACCSAKKKGAE